jgi:hypothetical protein
MDWKTLLLFLGVIVGWIVLNRWLLPMCGIETCCSSASRCCRCEQPPADSAAEAQEKPYQGDVP